MNLDKDAPHSRRCNFKVKVVVFKHTKVFELGICHSQVNIYSRHYSSLLRVGLQKYNVHDNEYLTSMHKNSLKETDEYFLNRSVNKIYYVKQLVKT